jgi:hypothetical protein
VLVVGSIHDVTSDRVPSAVFLRNVGSSHLQMSATEQSANMKFCVSLHSSPSEILRMFEDAAMKRILG